MTATMLTGTYRIVHRDSNDNTIAELLEKHSSEFGGVAGTPQTDPQKMPKVKKQLSTILKEDDKFIIMFKPSTATTEAASGYAHTRTLRVPVTFRNVRSGVVYEKTLVDADFTNMRPAAASQTWVVGTWYDIEKYEIPAQSELKLGHAVQDVRVDSALNLQRDVVT